MALDQERPLEVELISFGSISPLSTTSLIFIAPAMETALEELQREPYAGRLNFAMTIVSNANGSHLNGNDVPFYSDQMVANWYYMDRSKTANVSIIVLPGGPEDVYINRFAANWNILFLTCGSIKAVQRNKRISPTWVSTDVYSSPDAARFYAKVCSLLGWKTLFVLQDKQASPVYYAAAGAVIDQFSVTSHYQLTLSVINVSSKTEQIESLELFATSGRVLLFFGHAEPFRQFMVTASKMNMTNENFVYIVLEPFRHNLIGPFSWHRGDQLDSIAKDAFRSVLFMALDETSGLPGPSEPAGLRDEWKRRSRFHFNYSYSPGEMFLPHVGTSRYTVHMLAQMLNESRSMPNIDYSNGKILAQLMSNRTFTVDGKEIVMDQFGQREMNWTLSYYDNQRGHFQVFLLQTGAASQLAPIARGLWYGRNESFPKNEPRCGYRGNSLECSTNPAGAPYSQRAIPPSNLATLDEATSKQFNHHIYQVLRPFDVLSSPIAPFEQPGQGVQYFTGISILTLTKDAFLGRSVSTIGG
ncbi:hypothetical protein BV898_15014 [Hypsibius exemplaris]|uniref:Receptor ligand binding region domain-containing protein n=1 Tax=Hypsibius exemplaris TaxID=2072580 RepID=A0A9X6NH32_HYPEX|nr:hypothetical protein BV898_15014 [Hypsibius exemplaris]